MKRSFLNPTGDSGYEKEKGDSRCRILGLGNLEGLDLTLKEKKPALKFMHFHLHAV